MDGSEATNNTQMSDEQGSAVTNGSGPGISHGIIKGAARAISQRWERARDGASSATTAQVPYRAAAPFSELPVYQAMARHRDLAEMFGIANPFYRTHEGRSGSTTRMAGKEYINFASYDYCGLNQHPAVGEAAKAAIDQYGTSVSASRIVAGERPLHRALEVALAEHYGVEDAIAFVSGHATNVSTIGALMGPDDLILHDEFVHNSAIVGAKLSRATCVSFRHNNLDQLDEALKANRAKYKHALIVVEGLYSMDGDFPDLPRLIELKRRYGAWLMVDEAHALGVLGDTGRGIMEHFDTDPLDVDIWMGTLSKTLGGCGGYIAGKRELVEISEVPGTGLCLFRRPFAAGHCRRTCCTRVAEGSAGAGQAAAGQRQAVPDGSASRGPRYRNQRRLRGCADHRRRHHQGREADRAPTRSRCERATDLLPCCANEGGACTLLHNFGAHPGAAACRSRDHAGRACAARQGQVWSGAGSRPHGRPVDTPRALSLGTCGIGQSLT